MITQEQLATMTPEAMAALVMKLQVQRKPTKLTLKVSAKGAVSVYGFGKWPVTLYKSQWERLIESIEEVKAFLEVNDGLLATKD